MHHNFDLLWEKVSNGISGSDKRRSFVKIIGILFFKNPSHSACYHLETKGYNFPIKVMTSNLFAHLHLFHSHIEDTCVTPFNWQ